MITDAVLQFLAAFSARLLFLFCFLYRKSIIRCAV